MTELNFDDDYMSNDNSDPVVTFDYNDHREFGDNSVDDFDALNAVGVI